MLCELAVDNIGTYVDVITQIDAEQQYRMWFRGQSDYSWGLVPSVQRKDGMGKNYEQYISTNFMIHTMRLNSNAPQQYDRASWLTLMQHYGLPTRLLDWSESPLVALYFALSGDEDAKTDAAVWVLNPMKTLLFLDPSCFHLARILVSLFWCLRAVPFQASGSALTGVAGSFQGAAILRVQNVGNNFVVAHGPCCTVCRRIQNTASIRRSIRT